MKLSEQFYNLAKRLRDAETQKQFTNATERAGQLAFTAIDAGLIEHPLPELEKPQRHLSEPNIGPRYAMAWGVLVGIWAHIHHDEIPPNPMAFTYVAEPNGITQGTQGEWQSIAQNYADVCEWLAAKIEAVEQKPLTTSNTSTPAQAEANEEREPYPHPDEYERDKWIYENIDCHSKDGLSQKLKSLAKLKSWNVIESRNGFKIAADRYAKYHGKPTKRFLNKKNKVSK